jgi:hypothetical protein
MSSGRVPCGGNVVAMADSKKSEIELVPDAWPRFERFIQQIAKAGPQHKAPKKAVKKTKAKKENCSLNVSRESDLTSERRELPCRRLNLRVLPLRRFGLDRLNNRGVSLCGRLRRFYWHKLARDCTTTNFACCHSNHFLSRAGCPPFQRWLGNGCR